MDNAVNRILSRLGQHDLLDVLTQQVSLSELNTVLLDVFKNVVNHTSHGELLRRYVANRFVQPAQLNAIELRQMELDILRVAESFSYQALELSPVAPLGSCSVVATVDQNKIISALRGKEVVADATNALALYICSVLKGERTKREFDPIRVCAAHRHVRAQNFNQPGLLPHFSLFCMVTGGKDSGSYTFESSTLLEHLRVYHKIFSCLFRAQTKVRLKKVGGYKDGDGFIQRLDEHIRCSLPDIDVTRDVPEGINEYYQGLQFTIIVNQNGQDIVVGDGGFVDWSQKLLANKKERMMISAIGLDRILTSTITKA